MSSFLFICLKFQTKLMQIKCNYLMNDKRENLVLVLQETISRLEKEECEYQWTNQGK